MSAPAPGIDVIIATKDRRELLLKAVDGILAQDYPGEIRLTIVFDQVPPDPSLERAAANRSVRVLPNSRTPGLAGGRNTGLLAADRRLVAFCDDDDVWRPAKAAAQVARMRDDGAQGCVTGILVHTQGRQVPRVPAVPRVTPGALHQGRLTGAHPSSYLFDRAWLLGSVGLVDEELPSGYGEDFDLLLRCAQAGTVTVVPEPLVDVLWHPGSFFTQRWQGMADGLGYLLAKHPGLTTDRKGYAWMEGQRAFALAAGGGRRAEALRAAARSLRHNGREPRGVLAAVVALGLVSPERVMRVLNARGHGI
ncbi:glycosyltransferase family 2 protein [Georgenia sp. TF02-10]|uniref:glycosyltransferase family 2 protein n=1 Tax=Georgenia sp. TF02-10 TaxID=2917725 RepID=UPI001FA717D3|nr:glycosyltransferase family A protein [Georgenia sp. TF02-10]UNX55587.1 glycosyltransferase family 2 protein [Georgenia sp. TF02-10]